MWYKPNRLLLVAVLVVCFSLVGTSLVAAAPISAPAEQDANIEAILANCPGAMPPRLIAGQQGQVTPGLPNILRSQPGQLPGSVIVGQIPGSGIFSVLAGYAPQCYNGRLWWYVNYNNLIGWTPEAEIYGPYWTEPLNIMPPPGRACMTSRLTPGGRAYVIPGSANALRTEPRRGTGSIILAYIPSGAFFDVLAGYESVCTIEGVRWWYVQYAGIYGWTPESNFNTYWVAPFTGGIGICNNGLPNRLTVGGYGRITPGLPNSLRAAPSIFSQRIGYIYAGETFTVLEGPQCDNGIPYYRVQTLDGRTGWTGEGRWGSYWVEPA
jgi:hypothetical protein